MTEAARTGLGKLDKTSPMAKALKRLDVEAVLKNDIHEICEAVSFPEMMKAMSLVAAIKLDPKDAVRLKDEIKTMARGLVERVEKKGKLQTPLACREILFNL